MLFTVKSLSVNLGFPSCPGKVRGGRWELGVAGGGGAELWEEPSQSSFRRREKLIGTHGSGGQGIVFERLASSNAVDTTGAAKETAC